MRISDWSSDVCSSDLPTGRWRGNADSYTAFFTECFIDEIAARAGSDALSYRMAMLGDAPLLARRSEEHTSELQSLMRISYAVFCLKKKTKPTTIDKEQRPITRKHKQTTKNTRKS